VSDLAWLPSDAPATRMFPPKRFFIGEAGQLCKLELQFSFFFDGTRNHKDEDKPRGAHSNVARLFEVCKEEELHCQYRLYVQGVGTPHPQIGEPTPHPDGAKAGEMGWERLRFAMLFLVNRVAFALNRQCIVLKPGTAAQLRRRQSVAAGVRVNQYKRR
jgi:hypothetical protein